MRELLQAYVEGLDVEKSDLVGRRGVQLGAPIALGVSVDAAWAVQGSVTVLETWTRRPHPLRSEISSSWAAASSHQGHSVAQCAASSSARGLWARASDAGWWRRSAVRKASTPSGAHVVEEAVAGAAADRDGPYDRLGVAA